MRHSTSIEHAQRQGARRRGIETAIGALLKKTFPALRRIRATVGDERAYVYRFTPLGDVERASGREQLDAGKVFRGFREIRGAIWRTSCRAYPVANQRLTNFCTLNARTCAR
jgi:hypothetical protein